MTQLASYYEIKNHSSASKQALLDFLPFSPALSSAQWSFTFLTKSSQDSSKDKLYIVDFLISISD